MEIDRYALVLVLFLAASGICTVSAHDRSLRQPINPKLTKDLRKDYPVDTGPNAGTKFHHPFPSVQDTDKFEYDYVKDDHKDGGEFRAQSEYDRLRAKVARERQEAADAKRKEQGEDAELKNAIASEHDAEERSKSARAEADEAKKRSDEASHNTDELDGKKKGDGDEASHNTDELDGKKKGDGKERMPGSGPAYTIPEAEAGVKAAATHLEGCKEELEKAQKNLNNVMANQEALKRIADEKRAGADGEGQANATAAGRRDGIHNQVLTDEEQHALAQKRYDQELKDVGLAEKELQEAAKTLAKFRGGAAQEAIDKEKDKKKDKEEKAGAFHAVARSGAAVGASFPSSLAVLAAVACLSMFMA